MIFHYADSWSVEGIFRVSGSHARLQELKEKVDNGNLS